MLENTVMLDTGLLMEDSPSKLFAVLFLSHLPLRPYIGVFLDPK